MWTRQRLAESWKNRPVVALALLLAAILLPFGLLQYAEYRRDFPNSEYRAAPEPIFLLERITAVNEFVGECGGNVRVCGHQSVKGMFARPPVAPGVALIFGLVLPQMLLLACAAYTFDKRGVLALTLTLAALLLIFDLVGFGVSRVVEKGGVLTDAYSGVPAQLPLVETFREPLCRSSFFEGPCEWPKGEMRGGYFLDRRLPNLVALALGVIAPALMLLVALWLTIASAWRGWITRHRQATRPLLHGRH